MYSALRALGFLWGLALFLIGATGNHDIWTIGIGAGCAVVSAAMEIREHS